MKFISRIPGSGIFASLLVLSCPVIAGLTSDDNILADGGKVKPSIKVTESYVEKIVSEKFPGEPTERRKSPWHPLKITVVGNLEGFDPASLTSSSEVGFAIGGFEVKAPLSLSKEAINEVFPPGGTKATFGIKFIERGPNNKATLRTASKLTFSWAKGKLVMNFACRTLTFFEESGFAATDFIGIYVDESPEGTKPSGSKNFEESRNCTVFFGDLTGNRTVIVKGTSTTKAKKFGKGDDAEVIEVESVKLKGTTGPVAVLPD